MLVGAVLGLRMKSRDAPVLVIESGVRNVGVALILGGAILTEEFSLFASFLAGYFVIEIVIVLTFAEFTARRGLIDTA